MRSEEGIHLPPLTPLPRAANIRSVHTDGSTQVHSRGSRVLRACLAVSGTDALGISPPSVMVFTNQPSCPPSLGAALLSALLVRPRSTLGRGGPPGILWTGVSTASALGRPVANLHYYAGSDSCRRSPPPTGLPVYLALPSDRSAPNHVMRTTIVCSRHLNVVVGFRASPHARRLAATPRRIGLVILRTDRSPPVTPHPASRRRSYLRLPGLGIPGHGLSPCRQCALTGVRASPFWRIVRQGRWRRPRSR